MNLYSFSSLGIFTNFSSSFFSGMGKKRRASVIDIDLDCDKVNEALKRKKKKRSSKV